jgi:DNA polymerase-3 subunit alpha
MRVYLEDARALGPISMQLKNGGKGIVTLVVPASEGREVEIKIPRRQQVNAALRAAIKSLPGVAAVESV